MFIFEQNFVQNWAIADPSMMTLQYLVEAKAALFIQKWINWEKVEMSLKFNFYYLR